MAIASQVASRCVLNSCLNISLLFKLCHSALSQIAQIACILRINKQINAITKPHFVALPRFDCLLIEFLFEC